MILEVPKIKRIESTRRQRTIATKVIIQGFGFWSGQDVIYSFYPAEDNTGIRFIREDIPNSQPIPALLTYRIKKPRQTSLATGKAQVDMVEHILAALKGALIDNCEVRVSRAEAPGLDGSARNFIAEFLKAGTEEQASERIRMQIVTEGKYVDEKNASIFFRPNKDNKSIYTYRLYYDNPSPIPNQTAEFDLTLSPKDFQNEIASCRTFLTLNEAEVLRSHGLGTRVKAQDILVYGPNGLIDNKVLFDNECARHKILDMIGDFSLTSFDLVGEIHAQKTGHQQNADALSAIINSIEANF